MVQYPGNQALNAAALSPVAHDHFLRSKEPRREVEGLRVSSRFLFSAITTRSNRMKFRLGGKGQGEKINSRAEYWGYPADTILWLNILFKRHGKSQDLSHEHT